MMRSLLSMRGFWLLLIVAGWGLGAVACGAAEDPPDEGQNQGGSTGDPGPTNCTGAAPFACRADCSKTKDIAPVCVDGAWACLSDQKSTEECEELCQGDPALGERCSNDGWICKPAAKDIDKCPKVLCNSCEGFEAVHTGMCSCTCEGGKARCEVDMTEPA